MKASENPMTVEEARKFLANGWTDERGSKTGEAIRIVLARLKATEEKLARCFCQPKDDNPYVGDDGDDE